MSKSSSHGVRCCFAQLNSLLSLLECRLTRWIQRNRELACLPQEPQSHNEAQDLLLLQDYVCKLSHAQRTLEDTYALLQQTELLAGVTNEQDCRAIRTACCCLKSLRIRVEARANVTERAVISRQLQLMQASGHSHNDTQDVIMHVIPIAGSDPTSLCFCLFWFGCGCVFFCLLGFFCFWLWFFGFLLGQLAGLRTGPLPVLLWLSTSRQPCMIITIHLFAAIERV